MVRKPEDVFAPEKNTAARREFIDYDYINQLSQEEQEWLAKFTDEYLGASFDINPTYCSRKDAIKVCKKELSKNPKKPAKWEHNLEKFQKSTEKFVQISGFSNKKNNLDLRKCRSIKLYRMDENGELSTDKKYKYNSIHDFETYTKDCSDRSNEMSDDIHAFRRKLKQESNEFYLGIEATSEMQPEEYLIWSEIEEEIDFWEND